VVNLSTLTSDYVAQDGDVLTGTLETNGDNAIQTMRGTRSTAGNS